MRATRRSRRVATTGTTGRPCTEANGSSVEPTSSAQSSRASRDRSLRLLHGEADLLPERQLEVVTVGVNDVAPVADRRAGIERSEHRSPLIPCVGAPPLDFGAGIDTDAQVSEHATEPLVD